MFGGSGGAAKSSSFLGGDNSSSNSSSILPTVHEEPACASMCPKLTYQQRVIGFAICAVFGWFLSLVGTIILFGGPTAENIRTFACLYVFGNVIALSATGFLLGPKSQCTKMWAPTRRYSTAFFLIMLIIVFIVAVLKQNAILVIFLLIIEGMAGAWYSLSYIPFARKGCLALFRRTGICMPCFYISDQYAEAKKNSGKSGTSSSLSSSSGSTMWGGVAGDSQK